MNRDDEKFLRRAVELAIYARAHGDAPFGSLLVGPDGDILSESYNTVLSDNDISAHPEFKLAKWAAHELEASVAAGTTMYTSCQPCGMCTGAIDRSGLGRVVFALSSEQLDELRPSGGLASVLQESGGLLEEARAAVAGYYA